MKKSWNASVVRTNLFIDDGQFSEIEVSRIKNVIEASIREGIYVILTWNEKRATEHQNQAIKFFGQISELYGRYPNLIYEIFPLPEGALNGKPAITWSEIKAYAEKVISAIRKNDPENIILVGTPFWSQSPDIAALDPMANQTNIAYSLSFYAASHRQEIRENANRAIQKDLPLFVPEYSVTDYTGDGIVDQEETMKWWDFLDEHKISYVYWALHDKNETGMLLKPGTPPEKIGDPKNWKESGLFVNEKMTGIVQPDSSDSWWTSEKMIILVIALFVIIIFMVLIGCLLRSSKKSSKEETMDEQFKKLLLPTNGPNMSRLRLIKSNELLIDETKKLGEGEFGAVYAAKLVIKELPNKKFPVAVKVINKTKIQSPSIEKDMLEEAGIMAQLDHVHLLSLIGIDFSDNIKIVTPLRPLGSLQKFLKDKHDFLGPREIVLYCYQIASAMEHLTKHKIVHRDLATRNVLMKSNYHVEVTDFGLSAVFADENRPLEKIPVRWTAIECLLDYDLKLYGEATDVWSFGVTCWEILTFASMPYGNVKFDGRPLKALYEYLDQGNRLERPSNCGLDFYKTLLMCWAKNPKTRHTFAELKNIFSGYKSNPYDHVSSDKDNKNPTNIHMEEADQSKLISELLGDNDYFYEDVYRIPSTIQTYINYEANEDDGYLKPKTNE